MRNRTRENGWYTGAIALAIETSYAGFVVLSCLEELEELLEEDEGDEEELEEEEEEEEE